MDDVQPLQSDEDAGLNPSRIRLFLKRWVERLTWCYLALVISLWAVVRFLADEWWPATVFIFGPRFIVGVPIFVLLPLVIAVRSWRSLWVIGIAVVIIMGPISGGVVSPDALFESADAERLRILTCNTDGNSLSRERFELLLSEAAPDIVVLQECNPNRVNDLFPKTWSQCIGPGGIRIASRFRVKNCEYLREKELGMQGIVGRYQLETPAGDLPVVNIHLPTPRNGFEFLVRGKKAGIGATRDQIMLRDRASETTRHWLGELESSVIIAGDFNLPCDSAIYRKHWSEFGDAFSEAGWGWGLTKQTKWFGVRIDHVIYGNRWKCRKCWVGPDVGSDHLPVIAELEAVRAE